MFVTALLRTERSEWVAGEDAGFCQAFRKKVGVILHKTTHTQVESDSFILDNEILIGLQIFLISPTDHKGKHHGEELWKN